VLVALAEETAAALSGAEDLSPETAVPVLQDALRVTAEQETVLSALVVRASVLEQDAVRPCASGAGIDLTPRVARQATASDACTYTYPTSQRDRFATLDGGWL
jgi:hypothetical protein